MKIKPDEPIRLSGGHSLKDQIRQLPQGMYQANRYDTDDMRVIHLWNEQGQSFDVKVPKQTGSLK